MIDQLKKDLQKVASPEKAKLLQRFFKTEKGEYGEGDIFQGATVPELRIIAKKYKDLDLNSIRDLLHSKIHEERMVALMILVHKLPKADERKKKEIFDFYLQNTKYINNWDLVDLSARDIVGNFLLDKDRKVLLKLAKSKDLWKKRIAIVATYAFIKNKESEWTFKIAEILLHDKHDLIHKAVGWMLREVEKNVSEETEEEFLRKHYQQMPRTMLRYAIEHLSPDKKSFYMKKL